MTSISLTNLSNSVFLIGAIAEAKITKISAQRTLNGSWHGELCITPIKSAVNINSRCTAIISYNKTVCICYDVKLFHHDSKELITTIPADTALIALAEFKSIRLL